MADHGDIDRRSLAMVEAIVARIDEDPNRAGLSQARQVCARWPQSRAVLEWKSLLELPWESLRAILLDPGEEGQRLRQSDPFVGILSPQERWEIYRRFVP